MLKIIQSNKIDTILKKYQPLQRKDLSKILTDVQNEFGFLTEEIIKKVSRFVGVSSTEIYGYASFYSMYNLEKPGRNIIRVCKGTACHVKGGNRLLSDIENYLGISAGETTEDGMFKIDAVSCLGICALAPVIMINGKTYSRVKFSMIKKILDEIREMDIKNES